MNDLIYLTDEKMRTLGLSEEDRQAVEHYKRVINRREILPMVHPTLQDDAGLPLIVATIIPPRTTAIIEQLVGAVRDVAGKILIANSNWCQCARQYMLLENGKAEWLKRWIDGSDDPQTGKPLSKTTLERKLEELDRMIQQTFHGKVPTQWAITVHEPPCEHCGKPRLIDQIMAYSEPGFIRNLLNVFLGGEFPLDAFPLFLEYLDRTIFNEDVIPVAKKKRVQEITEKVQLLPLKDKILSWVAKKLMMLEEEDQAMHSKRLAILSRPPESQATNTLNEQILQKFVEELKQMNTKIAHLATAQSLPEGKPTASLPNTSADSTNTMGGNGAGQPMMLTEDFRPTSEASTTNNTSNIVEK